MTVQDLSDRGAIDPSQVQGEILSAPNENPHKFTPSLLSSKSDHWGLLQVLVLPPHNCAMESAAVTHSTSSHF